MEFHIQRTKDDAVLRKGLHERGVQGGDHIRRERRVEIRREEPVIHIDALVCPPDVQEGAQTFEQVWGNLAQVRLLLKF